MQTRYRVTGMTCDHCVAHVTEEVSALSGVTHVTVSLADGTMLVDSPIPIDFSLITDAVSEAGDYTVELA